MKLVTVRVPAKLTLDQCQTVLEAVLGRAGCPQCYSGLNISFENAVDPANLLLTVEQSSLNVVEVGG